MSRTRTYTASLLSPSLERVVHCVYLLGSAHIGQVLAQMPTGWDSGHVSRCVDRLLDYAWLEIGGDRVRSPVGRLMRVVRLTPEALAYLPATGPLPLRPPGAPAPPAPYIGQRVPPARIDKMSTTWQPKAAPIARAGATDHQRYASHGFGC